MTIYIPMIILTVFLADIQERIRYRGRKISILLITLLPPTLVAAFRYNNGADYPMYFQLFTRLGNGSKIAGIEGKKLEVGFEYIVRLCQLVTRNQWFTFGAISFIISFLIFKECLNDSDHYRLSVLFYFVTGVYFDAYNGLRQYIAVSICFYAMKYILNKDAKRYFLAVLIAFLFHKSALFFVPVYFLQYLKFDFKKAITIVGLTVLSGSGLYIFVLILNNGFNGEGALYICCGLAIFFNYLNIDWIYQGLEEYGYITGRSVVIKCISLALLVVFVKTREDYVAYALLTSLALGGNYIFNVIHARKMVGFTLVNLKIRKHIDYFITMFQIILFHSFMHAADIFYLQRSQI